MTEELETHPDADIYRSLPGLGVILGARVLGEFGDDPNRYTTAKSRKNYAGTSPLTVASVMKRRGQTPRPQQPALRRNRPLGICALATSPGARAYYDHRRDAKDTHHQALRALDNRLVGILHGSSAAPTTTNTAWAHRTPQAA